MPLIVRGLYLPCAGGFKANINRPIANLTSMHQLPLKTTGLNGRTKKDTCDGRNGCFRGLAKTANGILKQNLRIILSEAGSRHAKRYIMDISEPKSPFANFGILRKTKSSKGRKRES